MARYGSLIFNNSFDNFSIYSTDLEVVKFIAEKMLCNYDINVSKTNKTNLERGLLFFTCKSYFAIRFGIDAYLVSSGWEPYSTLTADWLNMNSIKVCYRKKYD